MGNYDIELLSPAGNYNKMVTAFYYGADAVYAGGNNFSLRANAGNFNNSELEKAVEYAHSLGKKFYLTINIYAHNQDIGELKEYLIYINSIKVDAIIVSDLGVLTLARRLIPSMDIHISTQANTTNYMAAQAYCDIGASRIVLARELSIKDIAYIKDKIGDKVELEAFVHGAMCVSYSGRCLLSNYLTSRDGNRGECVQACRWQYNISEVSRSRDNPLIMEEDNRGVYIMNSKDLNMIKHIKELAEAGIKSFKIEGRMKTEYYIATVTNAYRRAIDCVNHNKYCDNIYDELYKIGNRGYTTGYFYKEKGQSTVDTINYENSVSYGNNEFIALVKGYDDNRRAIIVEQRNRFKKGDILEILSPNSTFLNEIVVECMYNESDEEIEDAKLVQQILYIPSDIRLNKNDILRRKTER